MPFGIAQPYFAGIRDIQLSIPVFQMPTVSQGNTTNMSCCSSSLHLREGRDVNDPIIFENTRAYTPVSAAVPQKAFVRLVQHYPCSCLQCTAHSGLHLKPSQHASLQRFTVTCNNSIGHTAPEGFAGDVMTTILGLSTRSASWMESTMPATRAAHYVFHTHIYDAFFSCYHFY
jgi:hypothetical protein